MRAFGPGSQGLARGLVEDEPEETAEEAQVEGAPQGPMPAIWRSRTIGSKRRTRAEKEGDVEYPEHVERPEVRGDCVGGPRPCPWVSCRWNLYLDVVSKGHGVKLNFPGVEPDEMLDSCALDVADRGPHTLIRVGDLMNLTRQRVEQMEGLALAKVGEAVGVKR